MSRFRLVLISLTALLFTFFPLSSQAFDARCFTLSQCMSQNGFATGEGDIKDFFYSKLDARIACGVNKNVKTINGVEVGVNAANEPVGFCLASGQAVSKIAIGGRRTFSDIGQFIKYGYEYGMWVAGILATTMIAIAGFQWLTSGGNSDAIGSAKKKIAGAITGLLLLSLSYVILNTVNPYLVELRLPKTWMINTIQMAAPFCSEVNNANLAYLGPDGVTISDEEKNKKLDEAESNSYPITPSSTVTLGADGAPDQTTSPVCGYRYLVDGTGGQSCVGDLCGGGSVCVPFTTPDSRPDIAQGQATINKKDIKYSSACWSGGLVIDYKADSIFDGIINKVSENYIGKLEEDDNDHWFQDNGSSSGLDNDIWIYPVCKLVPPNINPQNYVDLSVYNNESVSLIQKTFGNSPFVIDEDSQYIHSYPLILTINRPNTFREYLVRYQDITQEKIDQLRKNCILEGDGYLDKFTQKPIYAELVGIVIKNQINTSWSGTFSYPWNWGTDALVYTYKDKAGKGTADIWRRYTFDFPKGGPFVEYDYFLPNGYIPIADIDGSKGKGLYLDFNLPPETIQNIGAAVNDSGID